MYDLYDTKVLSLPATTPLFFLKLQEMELFLNPTFYV